MTAKKKTTADFITDAIAYHGTLFNYSEAEYTGWDQPVKIICNTHGRFYPRASSHTNGTGCPKCAADVVSKNLKFSLEDFINKAIQVHGCKYSYTNTIYIDSRHKVNIFCTSCKKEFYQLANGHLQGRGCPDCQDYGFKNYKPSFFYILTCENVIKVGITNRKVEARLSKIVKSSKLDFKIFASFYFSEGKLASTLEDEVLKYLRSKFKSPKEEFDGYTECFLDVDLEELMKFVSPKTIK